MILNTQNTFRKLKKHVFRVFFNENTLKIKNFCYFIYININNIYNFLTNTFKSDEIFSIFYALAIEYFSTGFADVVF